MPGQSLHLVQRGVNRSPCFASDDDREVYLRTLRATSARAGCAIHAYVLMTNHVHLLISASGAMSPARMMQALGRGYVRHFNVVHGRTGTLWEGRYRSALIDSERYLLTCSRYIELNPVRAGIVASPEMHRWSSFRCNALGEADSLVAEHPVYTALDSLPSSRREAYRALFTAPIDPSVTHAIRRATNAGTVIGSTRSRQAFERVLDRPLSRATHGGDRRSVAARDPTSAARASSPFNDADPLMLDECG